MVILYTLAKKNKPTSKSVLSSTAPFAPFFPFLPFLPFFFVLNLSSSESESEDSVSLSDPSSSETSDSSDFFLDFFLKNILIKTVRKGIDGAKTYEIIYKH